MNGDRIYWETKGSGEIKGIVVLFSGFLRKERNLKAYVDLYGSLGWSSLVCHVDFLTTYHHEKATSLASGVLNELVKEVKVSPLPVILTSYSGGSKGCLFKLLQLVEGKCEGHLLKDEYKLVGECICGQIYDSNPVDFASGVSNRHEQNTSQPLRIVSWMARGITSSLDALFINRSEAQIDDYCQTLYSVKYGPFLIFYSEEDDRIDCKFVQRLRERGGDVRFVKWNKSHALQYETNVSEFLTKTTKIYMHRKQLNVQTSSDGSANEAPKLINNLQKPRFNSKQSLDFESTDDDFFLPSSMEFNETRVSDSSNDAQNIASTTHGVLSQLLYDVCVPENIEEWDIKPGMSLGGKRRNRIFNPMNLIRRSRL